METKVNKGNAKKNEQLGMSYGKANNILKKSLLFYMAQLLNKDICLRCGKRIETVSEFSIDHNVFWLNSKNPSKLFFDLENVYFSHRFCNTAYSRRRIGRVIVHGTSTGYRYGCRCLECTNVKKVEKRIERKKKKEFIGK